jgi:hypothetical protein
MLAFTAGQVSVALVWPFAGAPSNMSNNKRALFLAIVLMQF